MIKERLKSTWPQQEKEKPDQTAKCIKMPPLQHFLQKSSNFLLPPPPRHPRRAYFRFSRREGAHRASVKLRCSGARGVPPGVGPERKPGIGETLRLRLRLSLATHGGKERMKGNKKTKRKERHAQVVGIQGQCVVLCGQV